MTPPDDVERIVGEAVAKASTPPDPKRPLFRELPPPPNFEPDALGPLRSTVETIQLCTQAPLVLCAQSALAAATLAAQAQRDVALPSGVRPIVNIFVTVAVSGERKTATDKIALAAVYGVEQELSDQYPAKTNAYYNEIRAWKADQDEVAKKYKADPAAMFDALNATGEEPKKPPAPMLLVADLTSEALILHLRDSRPYAGIFTSEGGILIGGPAFNDENRMRMGALLNTLWDGEPIRRARVLTGIAFLPGRRVSAHVMMQQAVADNLLGDAMLDDMGTLARVLVVAPMSTIGTRMFREAPLECRAILDNYNATLRTLLLRPPVTRPGDSDVLDPPIMCLDADARRLWIAFHDQVERDLCEDGTLHSVRAFGAKLADHAGRLAAVLALYADVDAMVVRSEQMACGIELARHYAAEALRLKGGAAVAPTLRHAQHLLAWWQARQNPQCHLAQIYQGLNAIGDAATARKLVTVLEEHGWVRRLLAGTTIDGAPRRDAWELVP